VSAADDLIVSRHGEVMGSRVEDLLGLARMLDEGKVSQDEYEVVKAEILAAPAEEWLEPIADGPETAESLEEALTDPVEDAAEEDDTTSEPEFAAYLEAWIGKARALPATYRWGAGALVAVILGVLLFGGGDSSPVQAAGLPPVETQAQVVAAAGSLGILLEAIDEAWNDAGAPPRIDGAFALTPEAGPLDSFFYRFDDAAVLAGAYEPGEGAVYALMLRVGLMHGSLGDLNSRLCHLLHPFDQTCLDSLIEEGGISTATAAEFEGLEHESAWSFDGNSWRLTISGDVETIRVIAPGQP
jgi:hypothetical protein